MNIFLKNIDRHLAKTFITFSIQHKVIKNIKQIAILFVD